MNGRCKYFENKVCYLTGNPDLNDIAEVVTHIGKDSDYRIYRAEVIDMGKGIAFYLEKMPEFDS